MPKLYKFSIHVAMIALVLGAFVTAAVAQSAEKSKKSKQSGWIGGDSASIIAAFNVVTQNMLQNYSNLQALSVPSVQWCCKIRC